MKVLVLSSLFPNALKRHEGMFVFKEIKALSRLAPVRVIAPIYRFPLQGPLPISKRESWEGIEVFHPRVPCIPFVSRWLNGLLCFISVWGTALRLRRRFAFDVIYAHFVYPEGFAGVLLGKYFRVPVVLSARGSDIHQLTKSRVKKMMIQWVLKSADRILCVSEELKKRVLKLAPAKRSRVLVNYNGVCLSPRIAFGCSAFFRKYRLDPRKPVILSVGHFIPLKNHLLLIDAMKVLQSECQLVIIGDGPMRKTYEKKKEELGLNGSVRILGPFSGSEILRWYRASDILAHPSFSEGLPNVVLESMAMAKPVVASRTGGLPEIVRHGENGYLFDPTSRNELVIYLKRLIHDRQKRLKMGRLGRDFLMRRGFTWEKKAERTREALKAALGSFGK